MNKTKFCWSSLIVLFLFFALIVPLRAQVIRVVAGGGSVGDGGVAVQATLGDPYAVACDSSGNIYIADRFNNRIRKVTPGGLIQTIAGDGIEGFWGDGGPAGLARMNQPWDVIVDNAGSVLFTDYSNLRIRKIDGTTGIITTIAGNGQGFSMGNLNNPATGVGIGGPSGLALDNAGNLLFVANSMILAVDAHTGTLTRRAGTGRAAFSGDGGPAINAGMSPWGIAIDSVGNILVADEGNSRIRKINTSGIINTIAGNGISDSTGDGGPASEASVFQPWQIVADTAGNIIFTEGDAARVRKIDGSTGIITTFAGTGTTGFSGDGGLATNAEMSLPWGISLDNGGNILVTERLSNRVRRIDHSGTISTVAGGGSAGDGGPGTSAVLVYPPRIAMDSAGNLIIADARNSRLRQVSPSGIISTLLGHGFGAMSPDGTSQTQANMADSESVALDSNNTVYFIDHDALHFPAALIRKIDSAGTLVTVAGNHTATYSANGNPVLATTTGFTASDIAVDQSGNLFIADGTNNRVYKVDPTGILTLCAGTGVNGSSGDGGLATAAALTPQGLALDQSGNVYISDYFHDRVRKVDVSGYISTIAGTNTWGFSGDGGPATSAKLNYPNGIALDALGNLYIADGGNYRVRKVDPDGIISTFAGTGNLGFSGEGGLATEADMCWPMGVYADRFGHVFISDAGTNTVRIVGSPISATITVLSSSANPSVAGQAITLTAVVTGQGPLGHIEFFDGTTSLGTVPLSGASASLNTSALAPGTHPLTAVYSGDWDSLGSTGTLSGGQVVNKATATVTLGNLSQTYDGTPKSVTATTVPPGLTVTFTYNGVATPPTSAGSYAVVGAVQDSNYQGSANSNLAIAKATATVTLGNLSQTYDGTPKSATATTVPPGLTVSFTYNGMPTPPTSAGSYAVVGAVQDSNYQGSANNNLAIAKATATVTLGNLSQTYDGTPKSATATTVPPGLTVTFTYNGVATPPTSAGSYTVVGTVQDSNYQGSASGALAIAKANQTIAFGALANKTYGDADFTVSATASSGLPVSFTASGACTISANTVHITGVGSCSITAHQGGNGNYNAATDVPQTFTVNITYDRLGDLIKQFVTQQGVVNSLLAKLDNAQAADAKGNANAKAGMIGAFINEVEAQTGKAVSAGNAAILVTLANAL